MAIKGTGRTSTHTGLHIVQWNCRGWNSSKDEYATNIQSHLTVAPDIILLQEPFTQDIKLSGYVAFTHSTPDGGPPPKTGILVKKSLPSVPLDTDKWNNDHRSVTGIRIKHSEATLAVFSVYIPASRSLKKDNVKWIPRMISALTRNKEPTILAGDFNARHQKWGYPDADRRGKN